MRIVCSGADVKIKVPKHRFQQKNICL